MSENQNKSSKHPVETALALKNETPIFIGIEHVLYWPADANPCILIEPSLEAASLFLKQNSILKIPDNIYLVTGELGETPVEANQIVETALIIFKLFKLDDHLFQANHIYSVKGNPFLENLTQNVQLLLAAKKFHAENAATYTEISSSAKNNGWGALCKTEYVYQFLQRALRYQTNNCTPFYLTKINENNASSEAYVQVCTQLLQWLKLEKPAVLTWSNNTLFNSVGDILFLWEMLRRIGTPTKPVFTDYFFMQSQHLEGGIYFHLQQDLLPKKENKLLSIFPYDARIDAPQESWVSITPFHYTNEAIPRQKPLALENDFKRDIAIIHHSRLNTIKQSEINEFYELSNLISDKQSPLASFCLLNYFYSSDWQSIYPFNTYAARHLIRFLFFNFYSQIRIRRIKTWMPHLSSKWKINLYGENWDELFGKECTISQSLSPMDLQRIYQTSLVTLDFTPMYTLNSPNLNCPDCIHSGGMPLLMRPFLSDVIKPIDIPTFDTADDIDNLIIKYKNFEYRQKAILHLQNETDAWHQSMIHSADQFVKALKTHDYPQVELSSYVEKASQGYFLFLLGFFNMAFDKWCEALAEEIHVPLVLRLVSVGVGINEYSKCFLLLEQALKKYPSHAKLNEFHRKLGIKMVNAK
ncbi:MAG: hypothetical protein ACD_73C00822G0002 [uncultured bacterium]|nr:MAG: hypothetical protein ACD_73C00822G0002 [uncultured bacterium]